MLAEQWQAPLVDLVAEPADDALMEMLGYSELGEPFWLPWRMEGDVLTVATAVAPTAAIAHEAALTFGASDVEFRTTTDWDINQSIQRSFRRHLLYESAERLAEERPGSLPARPSRAGSATCRWSSWQASWPRLWCRP